MPTPVGSDNNGSSSSSQEKSSTSQAHQDLTSSLTSSIETTTSVSIETNAPQMTQELLPSSSSNELSKNFYSPKITKPWHQEVGPELRDYLVNKLVQNMFPKVKKVPSNDTRISKLFAFARKIEVSMLEEADSRLEYLHLIAVKIYWIRKDLEEKRRRIYQPQGMPGVSLTFFR